ncbi:hypothetical protein KK141_11250 [Dyella sp. LX-66]|uniref:hypothetical protein n=1 Tax=unclassified Dyella TaxID=2634549 RepID=UPI001BDFA3EC|nr:MULTISPECIES: hypothetical protein [unclassified Dyella]MBT2118901.1 hypothetical protein [Dyella sp. LX-1]MBT2140106.1 hypothetical protein [Dyella sp. LX-66]
MELDDLLAFLGYSELNTGLNQLLNSAGARIQTLSRKTLRIEGSDAIELKSLGLELAFWERETYERKIATPKDTGKAIFVAAFAYGSGSKGFKPYQGSIPFSNGPITHREDALREFGIPAITEADDVVDWDQWIKDGLQVRATYQDDGSLWNLSFSTPFK